MKHSLHDHIGYWISRIQGEIRKKFEQSLLKEDITIAQWCILISIFNKDAQSITELEQFIGVDKGSISRVLEKLNQRGLIERLPGVDRRSEQLCLSSAGEKLTEKLSKLAEKNDSYFFDILTSQEKQTLKTIIRKLVVHAEITPIGGWLKDLNTGEIMKEKIVEILEAGRKGEIASFVEYFRRLKAAGIKNYRFDLNTYVTSFYDLSNTIVFEKAEDFQKRPVNIVFDGNAVKKALETHLTQKTSYQSFIEDIQDAGVDHYVVDMVKNETHYTNKDESKTYIEKVIVD